MNKNFIKYAAVAVGGYLIGFYEMKYKTMKSLLKVYAEKENENDVENSKEEEA